MTKIKKNQRLNIIEQNNFSSVKNMSTFCRLCAEAKDPSDIITTINDSSRLIEQKLIACCQWDPQTTEYKLPQDVCTFCLDKLENCWLFSQSVKRAQHKIRDLLCERFETSTKQEPDSFVILPGTHQDHSTDMQPKAMKKSGRIKFDCTECFNVFSSRIALERHECNSIATIFQCNLCEKSFKTNDAFRSHQKNQEKFKCLTCNQSFCKERTLIEHKQQNCCEINSEESQMVAADEMENKPTFVECNYDMVEHINLKPEPNSEPETELEMEPDLEQRPDQLECNNAAPLIEIQRNREVKPHCLKRDRASSPKESGEREYECHLCYKRFTKFPSLKYHMFVHTLPRKYKCQYCNCTFRTERHYTSHQRKHIDYYCDICHKKFVSAFALKVHKRVHFGASVKMYGCQECDHYFIDVSTFYNHMKRRHGLDSVAAKEKAIHIEPNGTAKPYVCEQCGKDFFDRSSLAAHGVVHLDIRPFKCSVCPKNFKNKYSLKAHEETHTGERAVQCSECGKKCSCKSGLVKHMEEHTGVFNKTYPCGPFQR